MEDIKEDVNKTFEEKVKILKETIKTLDDWKYDFEEKLRKLNRRLDFVKKDISYLEK